MVFDECRETDAGGRCMVRGIVALGLSVERASRGKVVSGTVCHKVVKIEKENAQLGRRCDSKNKCCIF